MLRGEAAEQSVTLQQVTQANLVAVLLLVATGAAVVTGVYLAVALLLGRGAGPLIASFDGETPLLETDYSDWVASWRETLATNLIGPACVGYHAARAMVAQGRGGAMVFVGSRGARVA